MSYDDARLQYLHDAAGKTTAVLVPIELWEQMAPKDDSYKYTPAQLAEIEEGIEDYKAGRFIPIKEAFESVLESIRTGVIKE